jgi:hypothetical protein
MFVGSVLNPVRWIFMMFLSSKEYLGIFAEEYLKISNAGYSIGKSGGACLPPYFEEQKIKISAWRKGWTKGYAERLACLAGMFAPIYETITQEVLEDAVGASSEIDPATWTRADGATIKGRHIRMGQPAPDGDEYVIISADDYERWRRDRVPIKLAPTLIDQPDMGVLKVDMTESPEVVFEIRCQSQSHSTAS